jgi:hypothetical protein
MKKAIATFLIGLAVLMGTGCAATQGLKQDFNDFKTKLTTKKKTGTVTIAPVLTKKMTVEISDNLDRQVVTEMQPGDTIVVDRKTGEVSLVRRNHKGTLTSLVSF